MDAALVPLRAREPAMQYRTDVNPSHSAIYNTPGHSMEAAAADGLGELVASMEANGYDAQRPVIIVCNACTMDKAAWQWGGDDEIEVVQGRHRWLAAGEAGLDEIAAICMTHDEWEMLREDGDANDMEGRLLRSIEAFIAIADTDERISADEIA
jgi:hypothetical protein